MQVSFSRLFFQNIVEVEINVQDVRSSSGPQLCVTVVHSSCWTPKWTALKASRTGRLRMPYVYAERTMWAPHRGHKLMTYFNPKHREEAEGEIPNVRLPDGVLGKLEN